MAGGLYLGAVHTRTGQRADEAAIVGRSTDAVVQHTAAQILNTISVASLLVGGAALALLAVSRHRPRLGIGIAVMVIGANATTQLLKAELLNRPDLLHRPGAASTPSFPSGHATIAMTLALGFILVVPPRLRLIAGVVGITYAVLIGAGTLTAGWHRPSDVIAAYLIAAAWTAGLAAWMIVSRGTGRAPRRWKPMLLGHLLSSARLLYVGAGLLSAAFIASAVALVLLNGRKLTAVEVGPSYLGAVAAIAGTTLVILGVFVWVLRGALLDPPDVGLAEQQR